MGNKTEGMFKVEDVDMSKIMEDSNVKYEKEHSDNIIISFLQDNKMTAEQKLKLKEALNKISEAQDLIKSIGQDLTFDENIMMNHIYGSLLKLSVKIYNASIGEVN